MLDYEQFFTTERCVEQAEARLGQVKALEMLPELNWEVEKANWKIMPQSRKWLVLIRRRVQLTDLANSVICREAFKNSWEKELVFETNIIGYLIRNPSIILNSVRGKGVIYG